MFNGDNSLGKTTAADGNPSKILAARDGGDGSGEASGNPIRTTGSLTLNAHGAGGEGDQGMREDGEKEETYGEEEEDEVEEEEEEEMLDFNLDELEEQAPKRWLALARFYSVQRYNINGLFEEMRKAWLPRHKVLRKVLHENLFLLEFLGEGDYKFVTSGGPWIHKGDALLVVPYDGRSRPSEVKLDSIPLWVQILDLPGALMNEEVGLKLGGRIGKALEVHKDDGSLTVSKYLRVKVAVPLAKPLKPWLEFKISGVPNKFDLKYEKVPHFCFKCGRMGHAEKECQFKGHAFEGFRYGEELRGSPYKRVEARTRTMEAMDKPQAARNLFCANPLQLRKGARFIPEEQVHGEEEMADSGNVVGEANELASKVNELQVKSPLPLAVAKNTQKRTQTGVLSASKSRTSTVKSIANSLNEKKGSPSQSGLRLSRGSDRNWKHRPSAALDEVTSPAKVDNKAVAAHRAFDSLKNYLAAAEGSKKEACLASEQTDVHMTPVSPLGKRNTTEAPLNPSGQQGQSVPFNRGTVRALSHCTFALAMEDKKDSMELVAPPPPSPSSPVSPDSVSLVLGNDDLLRDILLRVGFPTTLVRAALVSKRWLRHAADPAFLSRFHECHPPRLLGFYIHEYLLADLRFLPVSRDPELDTCRPPHRRRRGLLRLRHYARKAVCRRGSTLLADEIVFRLRIPVCD
ncbi:hypothetical protein EJB05_53872, partial [Eragrostis curvula]